MEMEESKFKQIIATNITEYRKQLNLTQLELAERLNYSDKSISKWERAEATPDAYVLKQLSDLFGVSVDVLLKEGAARTNKPRRMILRKRIMVPSICVIGIFTLATIIYGILIMAKTTWDRPWLMFIIALLPSAIVLCYLSYKYAKTKSRLLAFSLLNWSFTLLLFFFLKNSSSYLVFIIAGAFQLVIIFWFLLYHPRVK